MNLHANMRERYRYAHAISIRFKQLVFDSQIVILILIVVGGDLSIEGGYRRPIFLNNFSLKS
jgi:hypothetical protein